ncbi:MAG: histidinol-phosphatase HisJ [Clostridiaceae bacterium]|nr:histidinol-phosphatase HisJ [Clostridiaceae bacterium]
MGNSPDEVKAIADDITETNDADGLKQALEKHIFKFTERILRDGHIHSHYCPHGTSDAFELYVNRALDLELEEITFTEHMPLPGEFMEPEFLKTCSPNLDKIEQYIKELEYIKLKYKDELKINTGFEVDYIEGYEEETKKLLNKFGEKLEDSILSVHFVKFEDVYYCVDYSKEGFGKLIEAVGSVEKVYNLYYETLLKAIKADLGIYKPKRIGHPTLVRIFNLEFPLEYTNFKLLEKIVKEIKERNYEVDFNTAGIRKPYCKEIYPTGIFADLVKLHAVKVVYGSDAHNALDVGKNFA